MLRGEVTDNGVPLLTILVQGRRWPAVIDTGFNGGLELPLELKRSMPARFRNESRFQLAGGVEIEEDVYEVEFPFDGQTVLAEATFVETDCVLIGTALLRDHRLEVHFPDRTVALERVRAA